MLNVYDEERIRAIERPHASLWTYYILACLPALIFPPVFLVILFLSWVRYSTLRYTFTTEGVSMRWGRLFRREILLNYARIQDIHLRSNVVERWFGLSRILIQTASGSSGAEMTIEGIKEYAEVRDFLYARMRGVTDTTPAGPEAGIQGSGSSAELTETLLEVARELRATREALTAQRASPNATSGTAVAPAPSPSASEDGNV
jgi:putative membrane protein